MDGAYSKFSVIDGNQFAIVNADVKDELFSVFTHGVAVKDELGQWASDSFMYQLPVSVTSSDTKLYNLGDTLVLSTEGQASTEYWVLQLRKPLLDPTTGEEPAVE